MKEYIVTWLVCFIIVFLQYCFILSSFTWLIDDGLNIGTRFLFLCSVTILWLIKTKTDILN